MLHDRDAVRHGERFLLVVRHQHEGDAGLALDALEFHLHAAPQFQIQRRQRLVEQQKARGRGQRTGEGDALLLPTGELVRPAFRHGLEPHEA